MYRACIAVVDASRARWFTYERAIGAEGLSEHLIEERDLVNPARRLRPVDLFTDSRPGTNRTGTLQYGVDDHRDADIERLDTEFSRAIVGASLRNNDLVKHTIPQLRDRLTDDLLPARPPRAGA